MASDPWCNKKATETVYLCAAAPLWLQRVHRLKIEKVIDCHWCSWWKHETFSVITFFKIIFIYLFFPVFLSLKVPQAFFLVILIFNFISKIKCTSRPYRLCKVQTKMLLRSHTSLQLKGGVLGKRGVSKSG